MGNKINRKSFKKSIAIVGDGLCEKIYFEQMKAFEKDLVFQIKPELPKQGGSWKKVFEKAKELLEKATDEVHCLIDYDKINEEKAYQAYQKARNALLKTQKVFIYECNPCFEMWFLAHYELSTRLFSNCNQLQNALKKYMTDYDKSDDYQKSLYRLLKNKQITAIKNAKLLEMDDNDSQYASRAEVFKLINLLLPE